MSGTMVRILVFGFPACSAAFHVQGANVLICLTWATLDFFVALPIKGICAIEQLICSYLLVTRRCESRERLGQKANSSSKFYIMQLP